jgi:hypothetical protein
VSAQAAVPAQTLNGDIRAAVLLQNNVATQLSLGKLLQYKVLNEKEAEKQGLDATLYGKDDVQLGLIQEDGNTQGEA